MLCKSAATSRVTVDLRRAVVFMLDFFIGRFLFRSGNQEHPGDKIGNTTVEILPVSVGRIHTRSICQSILMTNSSVIDLLALPEVMRIIQM